MKKLDYFKNQTGELWIGNGFLTAFWAFYVAIMFRLCYGYVAAMLRVCYSIDSQLTVERHGRDNNVKLY